jgi:hypothetical protein
MLKVGVHYNQGINANAGEQRLKALANCTTEAALALARRAVDHRNALILGFQFAQQIDGAVIRVVNEDEPPFAVAKSRIQFKVKLKDIA